MWLLVALAVAGEGRALFERNEFEQARATLEKAIRANPNDRESRYWLAFTCVALADHEAAIVQFERIEKQYARDPEFLFAASEAYTRRARQLSEVLSQLPAGIARHHQHLAHRHLARGDQFNALVELDLAIRAAPTLRGLHQERGEILWQQKKIEEAAKELQAELKLSPEAFLSNLRLGHYLLQVRRPADAVGHLRNAAAVRQYPEAHQLLAYALVQLGRRGEAQSVIANGLLSFPGDAGLMEMRDPSAKPEPFAIPNRSAEPVVSLAALRSSASTPDSLFQLNRIYEERAVELLAKLEEIAPESARLDQAKGLNAEYDGDYAAAEVSYREALRKAPQTAGLHFALGHVLRLQGRNEEAETELARDVQNHLTLYERGLLRILQGDSAAAVPLLEAAVKSAPNFLEARMELAKACLGSAQAGRALPQLEWVIARRPDHPTAHFLLSRAYRALGKTDLAVRELELHQKQSRK